MCRRPKLSIIQLLLINKTVSCNKTYNIRPRYKLLIMHIKQLNNFDFGEQGRAGLVWGGHALMKLKFCILQREGEGCYNH